MRQAKTLSNVGGAVSCSELAVPGCQFGVFKPLVDRVLLGSREDVDVWHGVTLV